MRHLYVTKINEVQIEDAGSVKLVLWVSSRFNFDALEIGEEVEGRGLGGEFNGSVEERRGGIRAIHGVGFVDFRAEERAGAIVEGEEPPAGFLQVAEAIAKVGSQCDAGSHGFCFTRRDP